MSELSVILTACPEANADSLAAYLVEGRFAACVSALPGAQSTYRWQDEVRRDAETLLLIKVPHAGLDDCIAALEAIHPYAVPEIVVLPSERVNTSYLAWAVAMTVGQPDTAPA